MYSGSKVLLESATRGHARFSKLPRPAPKYHHFANNLIALTPEPRVVYLGEQASYCLWNNLHASVRWSDNVSTGAIAGSSTNIVIVEPTHVRNLALVAEDLEDEIIVCAFGFESAGTRNKVLREISKVSRWEPVTRFDMYGEEWGNGVHAVALVKPR